MNIWTRPALVLRKYNNTNIGNPEMGNDPNRPGDDDNKPPTQPKPGQPQQPGQPPR